MKKIIETLKYLQGKKPMVYRGKGNFTELIIKFKNGISSEEIDKIVKPSKLTLPGDYVTLLNFSNGMNFFETSDCRLYDIKDIISSSKDDWVSEEYLHIATFYEDSIYLKCDGSERNVYISEEGFCPLRPMNMSLKAFLDASLCSGFSYFWLWGTDDHDLY